MERLLDEWRAHGKLIIALDFDDTIHPFRLGTAYHRDRYDRTISLLKKCQLIGAEIVLNTASAPDRFLTMTQWCEGIGLSVSGVNKNSPGLKYGHHGKVYANIYLDDRAGITDSLAILEEAADAMS